MSEATEKNPAPGEEILMQRRPALASFFVFFLGIALCLGGPLVKEDAPIGLPTGAVISIVFLAIIISRWSHVYTLTRRSFTVSQGLSLRPAAKIDLADIDGVEVNQGLTLRLFGLGHVLLHSRHPEHAGLIVHGIPNPQGFRKRLEELIREAGGELR